MMGWLFKTGPIDKRLQKCILLAATGGVLLQTGTCATQIAPLALSLAESAVLTILFGQGI